MEMGDANPWKSVKVKLEVKTSKSSSKYLKPRKKTWQAEIHSISNCSWMLGNDEDKLDRELVEMHCFPHT